MGRLLLYTPERANVEGGLPKAYRTVGVPEWNGVERSGADWPFIHSFNPWG